MRDDTISFLFKDVKSLLRNYMNTTRPQSFASAYNMYLNLKKQCIMADLDIGLVDDIEDYAKREQIERFGFSK